MMQLNPVNAIGSSRWLRLDNIAAFVATVAANELANIVAFGGVATADVSNLYDNLFTPAGYVFIIWGVIYLLLAVFSYYQYGADDSLHTRIDILFIASCLFNSVWIFLWHYMYVALSLVAMFGLLACLILIYLRLDIGHAEVSQRKQYMVHTTFSVYLGWITIASIANVSATAVSLNWDGFGINPETWGILIIIIALLLTLIVVATRKDIAYSLVVVWALFGIASKQTENPNIVTIAQVSAIIILIALAAITILTILKKRR